MQRVLIPTSEAALRVHGSKTDLPLVRLLHFAGPDDLEVAFFLVTMDFNLLPNCQRRPNALCADVEGVPESVELCIIGTLSRYANG